MNFPIPHQSHFQPSHCVEKRTSTVVFNEIVASNEKFLSLEEPPGDWRGEEDQPTSKPCSFIDLNIRKRFNKSKVSIPPNLPTLHEIPSQQQVKEEVSLAAVWSLKSTLQFLQHTLKSCKKSPRMIHIVSEAIIRVNSDLERLEKSGGTAEENSSLLHSINQLLLLWSHFALFEPVSEFPPDERK